MKKEQGFTLVEMLVVVGIFLILGGAVLNLLFSAIVLQRDTLDKQETVSQISFVAEYMSRAIREAQKDLVIPGCFTNPPVRNYGIVSAGQDKLRFLDKDGFCRQFLLDSSTHKIRERRSTDNTNGNFEPPIDLTSEDIEVSNLQFFIRGQQQTDNLQPRVTFFIEADGLKLQTTISQRRFDVEEI